MPDMLSHTTVKVLQAVMSGKSTVYAIGDTVGIPTMTTWGHLTKLRNVGLVDWTPSRHGTIHATCVEVRPEQPQQA